MNNSDNTNSPDYLEFQLEDGRYFDIGSYYTIDHAVFLAYSHNEPHIVGCVDDSDEYLIFTPEELKEIAAITDIEIPAEAFRPVTSFILMRI